MRHQRSDIPSDPSKRRGSTRNILAVVWGTTFGLLALWNFFGPVGTSTTKRASVQPTVVTKTPSLQTRTETKHEPRFVAKRIRDIEPIADRVIAKTPEEKESDETELSEAELAELEEILREDEAESNTLDDPAKSTEAAESPIAEPTKAEALADELLQAAQAAGGETEWTDYGPFVREHWRVIHFLVTRPDGDFVRIVLARPTWWLEAEQAHAGGKYEFDMEEVGAVGTADVVSIGECPEPPRRQNEHHRLVTGKFEHQATNVIDLYVEGQDEPIGTTANHPFWSEDRQAFIEAESLSPGENLRNAEGQRVRVINHLARPGPQTVFNIEVDGEHVYRVSADGLLVHNTYTNPGMRGFVNRLVNGVRRYMDPFTGSWRGTRQRLTADHIFPVNKMKELRGWEKLSAAQKREVMAARKNLTGLPSRLNSSKGDREARELTEMLGKKTSGAYRRWLGGQQANMRRHLQSIVDKMLGK